MRSSSDASNPGASEPGRIGQELWDFVNGKTVVGLDIWGDEDETSGIDLTFNDGSRLELYALPDGENEGNAVMAWALVSGQEVDLQ